MASSQIQTGDEIAVGESAESINTETIDDVFTASCYGDFEKLRKFVEQDGASLSLPDNDGYYALHMAALNNFPEIVQYIIEHGGDVNAVDDNTQQTALHWAAVEGSISVADVLLQNGAEVEAADVCGYRAVHVAAQYGQTSFLNHIVAKYNADFDVPDYNGGSPLHWAAYKGFVDTVRWLLSRDASQKRQDIEGCTPLHLAVEQDNLEVCTVLIDASTKQEIMVKDNRGNTPNQLASTPIQKEDGSETAVAESAKTTNTVTIDNVFTASAYGDFEKLRKFVEQDGASLLLPDNDGDYALHIAAYNNFPEIVHYIIEHGGDVNAVDEEFQQTALHWVAGKGCISVADVLLQNGAQVEAANVDGKRAVHVAAEFGQTSFLNHIVAEYNADFDVPDNEGWSPLHWAAYKGFVDTVRWLLSRDVSPKRQDKKGCTPLHLAVVEGNLESCRVLIDAGTKQEIMVKDNRGNTPIKLASTPFVEQDGGSLSLPDNNGCFALHLTSYNNFPEIAQYIIEQGGDVNAVNNLQQTALHWAARRGCISVADVLLQNGAQVEVADVEGHRAVHQAAYYGQTSFLNHIVVKHNADFDVPDNYGRSPLHWAAYEGFVDTVRWLLSRDASQKRQDKKGATPLLLAVIKGNLEVCTVLIDAGTKQEIMVKDNRGNTSIQLATTPFVEQDGGSLSLPDNNGCYALHLTSYNNFPEIAQYIIEQGGDVNAVNNLQQTALHWAARRGCISVADVLLQNGAQVEAADVKGHRAVHHAAYHGKTSFLNYIVARHNANFDVLDNEGRSPLHWAAYKGFVDTVRWLLSRDANQKRQDKKGNLEVCTVLIDAGTKQEIMVKDNRGSTPIQLATTSFFEQDGGSLSFPDNNGCYALHMTSYNNFPEIAQYIIEHGGDVNAIDNLQQTALHWAARRGCISVADVLLQNGAQVEAADVDGLRAVHVAAEFGQTSFLNHIVAEYNADFDVPDNEGWSPLHWAAYEGFVDTVRWLLSKDASKMRQDKKGATPLHLAAIQGDSEVCTVLIDASTKQEMMLIIQLASAVSQSARALLHSKVLQAECKHLQNSNFKGKALQKGTNWPVIIAMQGDAYTGKTSVAGVLALTLKCPIISLDDFLDASEPTDEQDTLILHAFNVIAQMVKTQISLGLSVVVDSPLSRLSHLQKLVALISIENTHNTQLLIIECKPENEYAYQLRFEKSGSAINKRKWHKPKGNWPLPKVPRDYTDNDIPHGVSKLVLDTTYGRMPCHMLKVVFDVTSCGYGHITKYDVFWEFIHADKKEQYTCLCSRCNTCKVTTAHDDALHCLAFCEAIDHDDKLCGVCDNQVLGPCYTCKYCPLALHESCAELARDGKKHFVPKSFPRFMPREPHMTYSFPVERPCAECKKDGNGFSYKCKNCVFESHLKSRLVPTVVRHKTHCRFLTLWLSQNVDGYTLPYVCFACKKLGQISAYCLDGYLYHLGCALLPPSLYHSHGGYSHDLEMITSRVEKEEDYLCDYCPDKMDPTAWYYYCSKCPVSLHLECAFKDFDSG